jgi:hypothetical protein
MSDSLKRLAAAGVDMDTDVRLNQLEVQLVNDEVGKFVKGDAHCVITYVLGGYYDASALDWRYRLMHPSPVGAELNSAQKACTCEITFEDACAKIKKVDSDFGEWVYQKGSAAVRKEETSKNLQGQQAQAKVVEQGLDVAAKVGGTVLDTSSFVSRHLLLITAAVVVAAGYIIARVYLPASKE